MALTSNQLIQINATIIAGLLVLLGIMTQQSRDLLFNTGNIDSSLIQFSMLVQVIIQMMIIPFALSATFEIIHSFRNKEKENNATKAGTIISAIGFILLVLFFALQATGGFILLYSN